MSLKLFMCCKDIHMRLKWSNGIQQWIFCFHVAMTIGLSDDLTTKIWGTDIIQLQSGNGNAPWTHISTLSGYHDQTIFSVHWSREEIICTGSAYGAIRLFVGSEDGMVGGPTYKRLLKKEKARDMDVNAVQWSSKENKCLASASDDGTVKIWDLTTASPDQKNLLP
ncbi:protein CIA1-like [Primulina tabacum]|uniref:protein CIA1-like n=1 Tax=Primulina tabacum TaxID=48773 RepID=UPI003F59FD50